MMIALPLLIAIQAMPGASVEQVKRDLPSISGKTVKVAGWLNASCGGLTCVIQDVPSTPGDELSKQHLSLAGGTKIEPQLVALRGRRVILTARAGEPSMRTMPNGDIVVMTDRASELIPIAVVEN